MARLALLFAAWVCLAANAMELGDARAPTQEQLQRLLSGNTLQGEWDGRPFTQHFNANGTTRYREDGGETTHGTWRIVDSGQYCSVWPPFPRETCYEVLVKGNNILWKFDGKLHPSVVSQGDSF